MTHNRPAHARVAIQEARSFLEPRGYAVTVRQGSKHTLVECQGERLLTLSKGARAHPPEHTRRYARQASLKFLRGHQ